MAGGVALWSATLAKKAAIKVSMAALQSDFNGLLFDIGTNDFYFYPPVPFVASGLSGQGLGIAMCHAVDAVGLYASGHQGIAHGKDPIFRQLKIANGIALDVGVPVQNDFGLGVVVHVINDNLYGLQRLNASGIFGTVVIEINIAQVDPGIARQISG